VQLVVLESAEQLKKREKLDNLVDSPERGHAGRTKRREN
jgi:hypothetical protein